jgi:hypothetical protein
MAEASQAHAFWRIHVVASTAEKVRRVGDRVAEALAVPVEQVSPDRYWKDPQSTELQLRTVVPDDAPNGVYAALEQAQRIAHGWQTSGPQVYDGGRWEFQLLASGGFVVPGVHWVFVVAANFDSAPGA